MATYFALTTHGQHWFPLAVVATTRAEAEETAHAVIGDIRTAYGTDIERETEHKNLRIVAKSNLRRYGWTPERLAERLSQMDDDAELSAIAAEQEAMIDD